MHKQKVFLPSRNILILYDDIPAVMRTQNQNRNGYGQIILTGRDFPGYKAPRQIIGGQGQSLEKKRTP